MRRLSRRGLVGAAAALWTARFARRAPAFATPGGPIAAQPLVAAASGLDCPEAIGAACLKALPPAEASREALAALILAPEEVGSRGATLGAELRRLIRGQSRRDFQNGAVIDVDGWILSLTEVRAYALATLLARGGDFVAV